jgi:type I restriction enzyme S subunit
MNHNAHNMGWKRSETGEEEMLTVSHLTGVTPRAEKDVNMFKAETYEGYKRCQKSDLVINTLWAWMGAMGIAPVDGIVSPAYKAYVSGSKLVPAYIDVLVRIPAFIQEVTRYSKGVWSSRLRLYPEGFYEVWLPVPSRSEQRAIVGHIKNETTRTDKMNSATQRSIVLLKERRISIISEAVIGKTRAR